MQEIQNCVALHWNYRNLKEIPTELIQNGEHVRELYLKRNCIDALPVEFGRLENLTHLYLIGNQLRNLPPSLAQLKCLKVMDLSQNYFRTLPSSIGDLFKLEHLLLTHNQIEWIPSELNKLKNLVYLELTGNRIRNFSARLFQGLTSLQEIAVDMNPIQFLPRTISSLKNLRYISACKCNLLYLPSLPFHGCLQTTIRGNSPPPIRFHFDGNPKLNHVPYWALHFFGPVIDCFGCGLENGGEEKLSPQNVQLTVDSGIFVLNFDQDLMKVNYGKKSEQKGSSLLELCVRQVYSAYGNIWREELSGISSIEFQLPKNLTYILSIGPYAVCFNCKALMFTETCPLFFKLGVEQCLKSVKIGSLNFCSMSCNRAFRKKNVYAGTQRVEIIEDYD